MVSARLGDLYANVLGNLTASRAWFKRAWRAIEREPPCVEQGWVAVAAMGCDVDDPAELLAAAELALDRARRFGDVNLETKALADAGLAHVQAGRVDVGMELLDEAMALACGPADDADTAAKSVCSFFTACYYAVDFARAGSWARLLRDHGLISARPGPPVFLSSHCESVQATLLVELGRWGEAEEILLRAQAEFAAVMPTTSWHPDIALADLRVLQGRFAEAEALLLGKDQAIQALLPAARLHLGRGDVDLACAAARRGLRVIGSDRVRAAALLTVLVEAELAAGDLESAVSACTELLRRTGDLDIPALQARTAGVHARVLAASGDLDEAIAVAERGLDQVDPRELPWVRAQSLILLARLHLDAGAQESAAVDAAAAAAILQSLDVVLGADDIAVLERLDPSRRKDRAERRTAVLRRDGNLWDAACAGTQVRLRDQKGLGYLAVLLGRPGVEHHALDLVDRIEGLDPSGQVDRRAIGDAGEMSDAQARTVYRRRIESLRADADDALAAGRLDTAEALQAELDELVGQLAEAYGLGGRARRAASTAERARLNVTRALRSAISKIAEALPDAGAVLDRRVRTGLYCVFDPDDGDATRWIVQS
ncbi:MAG: hypothetical protein ACRD0A_05945 [Acidimicrobiales bacterium]